MWYCRDTLHRCRARSCDNVTSCHGARTQHYCHAELTMTFSAAKFKNTGHFGSHPSMTPSFLFAFIEHGMGIRHLVSVSPCSLILENIWTFFCQFFLSHLTSIFGSIFPLNSKPPWKVPGQRYTELSRYILSMGVRSQIFCQMGGKCIFSHFKL